MLKINEVRDKYVRIRVTADEREKLQQQAKEKGFNTLSNYLRYLVNNDISK